MANEVNYKNIDGELLTTEIGYNNLLSKEGTEALENDANVDNTNILDLSGGINNSNSQAILGSGSVGFEQTTMATLLPNQNQQSSNFLTGVDGWQIKGDGTVEFNNGTFRGSLIAGQIHIPNTTTANSFHTDSNGNSWWGATTLAGSTAKILNTGAGTFASIAINGGTINGVAVSQVAYVTDPTLNIVPVALTCSSTTAVVASDGSVSSEVVLTWTAISTDTFSHYNIRFKKATNIYYTYITSQINTITIEGLVPNISYNFGLAAVNKSGNTSAFSADILQTTATSTTAPATVVVGSATAGIQSVIVKWTANSETDLAAYNVYRNTSNNSATATLWANIRTNYFVDSGMVSDGTTYYYWIKAINTSGLESASFSTVVSATPRNVVSSDTNIAHQGWTQTCVFSSTDIDTVSWALGVFTTSAGISYNITAGNTGNMAARTFIYLDIAVSLTAYQTTTNALNSVGDGKVLIGVAQNTIAPGTEAVFQIFGGSGGVYISGSDLVAGTVTTNEIAANTIQAGNIEAGTITATQIDTDTITSLGNLNISASQVLIDGSVTFLNTWFSYKGVYAAGTTYSKGDQVTYLTNYWNYINNTPASGQTPSEGVYWTAGGATQITTIDGGEITTGTITTAKLNFVPVQTANVIASINSSAEGITIDADNLTINAATTFGAGYDPTGRVLGVGGTYDTAASGARVRIFPDVNTGIQAINTSAADVFKVIVGGADSGDVIMGEPSTGYYAKWDNSAATFVVNDSILANQDKFGDGSDGDVTISADTTLTADMFYNNLTINSTKILNTGGYRIFVKGTLTNNGIIKRDGLPGGNGGNGVNHNSPGAAGSGGAALASGSLQGSLAGLDGKIGVQGLNLNLDYTSNGYTGTNGSAGAGIIKSLVSYNGKTSVAGGTGGTATRGADVRNGSPGGATAVGGERSGTVYNKINSSLAAYLMYDFYPSGDYLRTAPQNGSSSSGGSGGVSIVSNGEYWLLGCTGGSGGNGSNGGMVVIFSRNIINNGTISANGGAGGNGGVGADANMQVGQDGAIGGAGGSAGGMGGNGGVLVIVYTTATFSTETASGGAGGTGGLGKAGVSLGAGNSATAGSNGASGSAGNAGIVIKLQS